MLLYPHPGKLFLTFCKKKKAIWCTNSFLNTKPSTLPLNNVLPFFPFPQILFSDTARNIFLIGIEHFAPPDVSSATAYRHAQKPCRPIDSPSTSTPTKFLCHYISTLDGIQLQHEMASSLSESMEKRDKIFFFFPMVKDNECNLLPAHLSVCTALSSSRITMITAREQSLRQFRDPGQGMSSSVG